MNEPSRRHSTICPSHVLAWKRTHPLLFGTGVKQLRKRLDGQTTCCRARLPPLVRVRQYVPVFLFVCYRVCCKRRRSVPDDEIYSNRRLHIFSLDHPYLLSKQHIAVALSPWSSFPLANLFARMAAAISNDARDLSESAVLDRRQARPCTGVERISSCGSIGSPCCTSSGGASYMCSAINVHGCFLQASLLVAAI